MKEFQSPPHRGIFCDAPSSAACGSEPSLFQSPPHRGIFCDGPLRYLRGAAGDRFQSPPHRGIFCDFRVVSTGPWTI